jgi:O-acetylhomoserine (thiol)-lyase
MNDEEREPGTRAVHAGASPDDATGSRATPIHQTTSYVFEDAETAADLYALNAEGNIYSRISNPTVEVLEARLAALDGGVDAVATASGMGALDAATTVLASVGDNVVSSSDIYGGTRSYLSRIANRRGIEARFVDTLDYDAYEGAIDEDTAYVHVETIGNPSLVTPDLERVADIAHENGAPLFVDNTFGTPSLCRPIEHGADLVWASTTKWIHGSGTTIGGVLVDGGSFPWEKHADAYPEIAHPNPSFGGKRFTEAFGERAFAVAARHRGTRAVGHAQSPFDAWQTLQGIETLPLRMDRHCENALAVAEFLADHDAVDWVTYPGLESHPTHDNATTYLQGGFGGVVAFGPAGGFEAAKGLCEAVELASFLANIGDAKTLIIHPASTTHAGLSETEQRESGVHPDMIRLSVGIEDPGDIIADLDRGLEEVNP